MRNRSLKNNNQLFESILDDVNTSNIDVSSLADNGNDSFRQIEYGNYEYEVRIYFTSEVFYYDKLLKEQLPEMHDELSLVLENSRLFSAVSPVRIMAMTAELQMIEEYKDEPIIKYWTDEIDKPWAYYGWSAVFCCNMGPVKNVRRFLNFLGMAFAATYKASSAGRPIISFRKNDADYVTFWPAQLSYIHSAMKNELGANKKDNKKRSEYMGQFYLQFAKLSPNSGFDIANTLTSYFKIDWSQVLFERAVKDYISNNNLDKNNPRNVKLDAKTKNFLSTVEASTEMFERMGNSLHVYSYRFTNTQNSDDFFIHGTSWRPVKTLWGEAAKHPIKPLAWDIKTINGDIDYVVMFYLGVFDCSPYMKTEEENEPGAKSEPVHLVLVSGGDIYAESIETKFKEMLGNRFLRNVCDDITNALFANANAS